MMYFRIFWPRDYEMGRNPSQNFIFRTLWALSLWYFSFPPFSFPFEEREKYTKDIYNRQNLEENLDMI